MEDPAVLPDPVLPDPVPADPKVFEPVLAEPVLAEPVAPEPVAPEPVAPEPVLPDPELGPAAGGVVSAGLLPVPPPAGGLDGGDTAVEDLPPAGGVTVAVGWGSAVLDGCAELVAGQGDGVAPAVRLPFVALVLAFAEAVEPAPPVAPEVALAVPVTVTVTVCVAVAVALLLGLLLVLPLGGLLAELAGGALGVTDAAAADGLAWPDDGETAEHEPVTGTLLWTAELAPGLVPPADPVPWVADPFRLGASLPALDPGIPTAAPSWTTASRSGGTARATPMANTAQAAARAGRSSPYRHSRLPASPASCPPRVAFRRRVRPARKPARAAECRLAWAGPEPIRARIRSSPSGRGSS